MGQRGPLAQSNVINLHEGDPSKGALSEGERTGLLLDPSRPDEPKWRDWIPGDKAEPKLLRKTCSETWRLVLPVLESAGVLSEIDRGAFTDLCLVTARLQQCERTLARDGLTIEGRQGSIVRHPLCTSAQQYRAQLRELYKQFLLTPAARARMAPPGGGAVGDGGAFD